MTSKRFLAVSVLLVAPILIVQLLKQTTWGKLQAVPAARQKGDPQAKVLIAEFSDFQCPMCAQVQPAVHQLLEQYKGKVRFVYKYYPLTRIHPNAMPSAHAAECAADQNQFWPYHDKLFQTQRAWAPLTDATTSFMAIATDVKLDMARFTACYGDLSRRWVIEADAKEAVARQVRATPTFFIGEDRLVGMDIGANGARYIERALRE